MNKDDIIQFIQNGRGKMITEEGFTTNDVAEWLDVGIHTAQRRMKELAEQGKIRFVGKIARKNILGGRQMHPAYVATVDDLFGGDAKDAKPTKGKRAKAGAA